MFKIEVLERYSKAEGFETSGEVSDSVDAVDDNDDFVSDGDKGLAVVQTRWWRWLNLGLALRPVAHKYEWCPVVRMLEALNAVGTK